MELRAVSAELRDEVELASVQTQLACSEWNLEWNVFARTRRS